MNHTIPTVTSASTTPIINADNCHACWACFNHCPEQAIFTDGVVFA
ncbi:MAG: hypothetical protein GY943_21565 [Chloroflexi bacterium]|nr:hypothetical protein [Chloroflexota bacterium]